MIKRNYLLMMLAVCVEGHSTADNVTELDTLGVGFLGSGMKSSANTLVIVAKEKRENVLTSSVVQEAVGEELLIKC